MFRSLNILLDNLSDDTGANCTTTFTNREAQTLFHRNRRNQRHRDGHVVTWHHHLGTFRQLNRTSHVCRTEVELRTIAIEEWCMTTTFVLAQNVDLSSELSVRLDGTNLGQNLTTLDFFTLRTTQQHTYVVTKIGRASCRERVKISEVAVA